MPSMPARHFAESLAPGDQVAITIHRAEFVEIHGNQVLLDVYPDDTSEPARIFIDLDAKVEATVRMPHDWDPPLGSTWTDRFDGVWFVARKTTTGTARTAWMVGANYTSASEATTVWKEHGPLRLASTPATPLDHGPSV